ncbi:glucose-6-phosphate isomerase [Aestuariispira ectoiniformans]|uniref:glucose-6-phosphate isomerase n=1 Tax=Aestuariispira ectoiniformans TaxID=2775080 RepID=UPI00223C065A|nr:glucose-6-phosphate isomerase [Aestuariispira ectoiniformans]
MYYTQDITYCLRDRVEFGVADEDLAYYLSQLDQGLDRLKKNYSHHRLPWLHVPERKDDLAVFAECAGRYRAAFRDVVVLGTGGSSLGAQALHNLVHTGYGDDRKNPRLHIVSTIDPFTFSKLLGSLNLRRTGFIVISKSGTTAETLIQFATVIDAIRRELDDSWLPHAITVITQPMDSPVKRLALRYDMPVLDHDPNLGGRYSVLSVVGLLPAMIAGLDARALRAGAAEMVNAILSAKDSFEVDAAIGAAVSVAMAKRRRMQLSVMLTYSDRLMAMTDWYRQLWAESLGKDGEGTTPYCAVGPVDQHSQLQLWLDGPPDKFFTVLAGPDSLSSYSALPDLEWDPQLAYLANTRMDELKEAMCFATTETLAGNGRPVRTIRLNAMDELSTGAVMMHFMLETVLAAGLLNVNPYDQPAVEQGKNLVRAILGRRGEGLRAA